MRDCEYLALLELTSTESREDWDRPPIEDCAVRTHVSFSADQMRVIYAYLFILLHTYAHPVWDINLVLERPSAARGQVRARG